MGLTQEMVDKYLADDYGHCPFCGAGEVKIDPAMQHGLGCYTRAWCSSCGGRLYLRYSLEAVMGFEKTDRWIKATNTKGETDGQS